jgi:hypothetical protein
MTATPTVGEIDALAKRFWREAPYSGRDGQDFDHQGFARALLATQQTKPAIPRDTLEAAAVALEEKAWLDGMCMDPQADEDASVIRAAISAPDGSLKLVPLEPTPEMEQAFQLTYERAGRLGSRPTLHFRDAWLAALSAVGKD